MHKRRLQKADGRSGLLLSLLSLLLLSLVLWFIITTIIIMQTTAGRPAGLAGLRDSSKGGVERGCDLYDVMY